MANSPAPTITPERLEEIRALHARLAREAWFCDSEDSDGSYGAGDDTHEGFKTYAIFDGQNRRLFGCENADSFVGEVHVEHDEDGSTAWDEHARQRMKLVELMFETLPALLSLASRAQEAERARDEAVGLLNANEDAHRAAVTEADKLREIVQAIVDWADFALANKEEFDKHGARNLDGPVFDRARAALSPAPGQER